MNQFSNPRVLLTLFVFVLVGAVVSAVGAALSGSWDSAVWYGCMAFGALVACLANLTAISNERKQG